MTVYRIELSEINFYYDKKAECKLISSEKHTYDYRFDEEDMKSGFFSMFFKMTTNLKYDYERMVSKVALGGRDINTIRVIVDGSDITENIRESIEKKRAELRQGPVPKNGITAMIDVGTDRRIKYKVSVTEGVA